MVDVLKNVDPKFSHKLLCERYTQPHTEEKTELHSPWKKVTICIINPSRKCYSSLGSLNFKQTQ